ncbi:hypothetical protein [Streptomyces sp. NPDC059743]|uniref:hypothetical protein n=1 Tax=Streptomyces sp. NPDC059743 TaxID=3346928 RepID=UPI00364967D4
MIILIGAIVAVGLTGYGFATLTRHRAERPGVVVAARGVAAFAGAGAVALYVWGALHAVGAVLEAEDGGTSSVPTRECIRAGGTERAAEVDGYRIEYLPVRFVCHIDGGGSYATSGGPGYIGPAALVLALTAVALPVLTEYRPRKKIHAEPGSSDARTDREPDHHM